MFGEGSAFFSLEESWGNLPLKIGGLRAALSCRLPRITQNYSCTVLNTMG
jgi:hypothetical protein